MSTLDLSVFREILPQPKKPTFHLSVTNSRKITVSQQIYNQSGAMVRLFIGEKGKSVLLRPTTSETAFKITKNLTAIAHSFHDAIAEEGIAIPARYEMRYIEEENAWLGTLIPDMTPAENAGKKTLPKKPRKNGLPAMVPSCDATD